MIAPTKLTNGERYGFKLDRLELEHIGRWVDSKRAFWSFEICNWVTLDKVVEVRGPIEFESIPLLMERDSELQDSK